MLLEGRTIVVSDRDSGLARAVIAACEREGATVTSAMDHVDCLVLLCSDSNTSDLRARIETEVYAPLELTKHAVPLMKAQGRGSIVFVNATADAAAWGALYTGVQVLAKELGPANVRVNTVVPAAGEPPDTVADVVVFFASDLSAIVTGQSLVVSG